MLWTEAVYKKKHLAWYFPNLNMRKQFVKISACFLILHIGELPSTLGKENLTAIMLNYMC